MCGTCYTYILGNQHPLVPTDLYRLLEKLNDKQSNQFQFKWIEHIKSTLDNAGFSELWQAQNIYPLHIKAIIAQRLSDNFKQKWWDEVSTNSQCDFYRVFKETPEQEKYLNHLDPSHRYSLTKFRTRTNHLPITKKRFHNDAADVSCTLCSGNNTGDECHYLFQCTYFKHDRKKLVPDKFLNQTCNLNVKEMFSGNVEKSDLINLATFTRKVMSKFKYAKERHGQDEKKNPRK